MSNAKVIFSDFGTNGRSVYIVRRSGAKDKLEINVGSCQTFIEKFDMERLAAALSEEILRPIYEKQARRKAAFDAFVAANPSATMSTFFAGWDAAEENKEKR